MRNKSLLICYVLIGLKEIIFTFFAYYLDSTNVVFFVVIVCFSTSYHKKTPSISGQGL
jgi:hypothetical protein